MSQERNQILALYYAAVESFEYLETLFLHNEVDLTQVIHGLQTCHQKVENIISEENFNGPYLVDLFQVKQHVAELREIMQNKIKKLHLIKNVEPISKLQAREDEAARKKQLSLVKDTIEKPRSNGLKDIAGLWEVKKILRSLIILPRNQPQLFVNRKACNSVLLFGPPGTGKTRLVHAIAYEANANLHSISVSDMLSPLVGQTEKMKTELMCQMSKMEDNQNMFLICATNCPWDLDTAFLRRFQKQLYVPLPNTAERLELFQLFMNNTQLENNSDYWEKLINRTEGFSGSDISNLVTCALNIPVIELEDTKIWKSASDGFYEPVVTTEDFNVEDIICCELNDLPYNSVRTRPSQIVDLINALESVTPTVPSMDIKKYEDFIRK